jgi:hypothetical protein
MDSVGLAAAIARHLDLEVGRHELAGLLSELGDASDLGEAEDADAWWAALAPAERALAEGAIGPFLDHFADRGLPAISWGPELFFVGDDRGKPVAATIDITGRPRCLLSGPDILLPRGIWSLSAAIDFSAATTEHNFVLALDAGTRLARLSMRPDGAGVSEAQLTVTVDDLPERPLRLRLSNERAAFDGVIRLLGVRATRS